MCIQHLASRFTLNKVKTVNGFVRSSLVTFKVTFHCVIVCTFLRARMYNEVKIVLSEIPSFRSFQELVGVVLYA